MSFSCFDLSRYVFIIILFYNLTGDKVTNTEAGFVLQVLIHNSDLFLPSDVIFSHLIAAFAPV